MAGKGKGGNTVAAVWEIAAPVAEQLGLSIWDIRFQKEREKIIRNLSGR